MLTLNVLILFVNVNLVALDLTFACLQYCRYVQAPLAYPRERKRRMNGGEEWLPFCIYSSGNFAERLSPCYWSDYYSVNPRTPDITQLAPWVARFYAKV